MGRRPDSSAKMPRASGTEPRSPSIWMLRISARLCHLPPRPAIPGRPGGRRAIWMLTAECHCWPSCADRAGPRTVA
eukprot:scaffold90428_cov38-Phaeocystis_antarctica.AAC.3